MSDGFDVAARLAAGTPSVERTGTYVWACRQLGYQHPDLTGHPAQVRDWYAHEDGLDLRALDADHAALSAAAVAADDALRRHAELTADMVGAWSGPGAGAAREFLWRHGQSAVAVRDALRRAADTVAALRDELWRAVDTKVDAVQDIDDRRLAQRAEWLAAAQTVTTGAGDRAAASELVNQHIKPFVDNDIRSDWVAAMRGTIASVTAAYDAAIARLDSGAVPTFDVPGELGPRWVELGGPPTTGATVPAAASIPAPVTFGGPPVVSAEPMSTAAPTPPAPAPPMAASMAPPVDPMSAATVPPPAPGSPMPSLGDLGGGTSALGSSGFGQQLADLIGGLIGSSGDAMPEPQEIEPNDEIDDPDDLDDATDETEPADAADESDEEPTEEEPVLPDEAPAEPEPPPAATPVPPPPLEAPPIPAAVPEALPQEQTPCEIAADEVPQVGD